MWFKPSKKEKKEDPGQYGPININNCKNPEKDNQALDLCAPRKEQSDY